MTSSYVLSVASKLLVSVFLTYLLPLIPSINQFFSTACLPGLVSVTLLSRGSDHTSLIVNLLLELSITNLLKLFSLVESRKAPYLVPNSSHSTPLLSALSSQLHRSVTIFIQTISISTFPLCLTRSPLLLLFYNLLSLKYLCGCLLTYSLLTLSKTEFLVFGDRFQLSKLTNPSLQIDPHTVVMPVPCARNLGILFDSNLFFNAQISSVCKSCNWHICDLHPIRSTLDFNTAQTIASSLTHYKLDYCNSLYFNLPACQINRLQHIQNSLARAVCRVSKHNHITCHLKSLHWLKIPQCIQ